MRRTDGPGDFTGGLADFLATHTHALARAEVLHHWTRHHLDAALRAGTVTRVLPGVYCAAAHARHPLVMGEAVNLWAPRGLVTGQLALHLYASPLPRPEIADVATNNGDRMHPPPWVRVHQRGRPRASSRAAGVDCTPPERALLDAWHYAPPDQHRRILYEALWARVCTWRQLQHELARAPRIAERRDLERVLGWFAEGATTPLEVHAKHSAFADARFREFEWQVRLPLGTRAPRVDMLHRAAMVAVELDGDTYHSTRQARDDDRERQTGLAAAGLVVVRFGWTDVFDRPDWSRGRLLAVVASRLKRPGSQ